MVGMSATLDDRIAAAIAAAEAGTAAEIVVALVPRAHPYRVTALLAAFATIALASAIMATLDATHALSHGVGVYGYAGTTMLGIVIYLLCEHSSLGIWLTPRHVRRAACLARARLTFLTHGIDATANRLGLLIFVSEAEHHIEILPDRGIAAKITSDRWAALIEAFTVQVAGAGLEEPLTGLISTIGDELASHFPPQSGHANDLPDRPLRD